MVRGRRVIELGAGAGLPALTAAHLGASDVAITGTPPPVSSTADRSDFNDIVLIDNLEHNAEANFGAAASPDPSSTPRSRIRVLPHTWGQALSAEALDMDVAILADLVFNVSQHERLLDSCELALADGGLALSFYAFHRPHKAAEDAKFIDRAQARNWRCEEVVTQYAGLAFPDDEGDEQLRGVVHGWVMTLPPRSERLSLRSPGR